MFFVKTFESWLAKVEQGIRAIDPQLTTPEQIKATEELAEKAWEQAHPGWKIQRNDHGEKIGAVQIEQRDEPGPEALFADETPSHG